MGKLLNLIEDTEKKLVDRKRFFALNVIKKKKYGVSLKEFEERLKNLGLEYDVKNPNHVKVGSINFYLSTGTCYIDGMSASYKNKGIQFFEEVLRREGRN